ncbi:hypothetical protein GIB67_032445 [Kingdonia uniflora]|uniref:Uncharacterized protein n=1 Tax=Kingdonia uniflora TaxID=39325 RepID=A0A7J7LT32_9MAGN|nr:hypothetical protein GIB67_032445 [Kingdonia uniflora]
MAIETYRDRAEIHTGHEPCKKRSLEVLEEFALPKGLLPLDDILEVGLNREAGFVWLKQRKNKNHTFTDIARCVSYGTEVTAFVEKGKMKNLTGVKSKEYLIWITISEISMESEESEVIEFRTPLGLSRVLPASAFQLKEEEEEKN